MSERGTHLGDGAYIVPDQHGHHQLWFSANDHQNRLVALDPSTRRRSRRWRGGSSTGHHPHTPKQSKGD